MMARRPRDRYATSAEVASALEAWLKEYEITRPTTRAKPAAARPRSNGGGEEPAADLFSFPVEPQTTAAAPRPPKSRRFLVLGGGAIAAVVVLGVLLAAMLWPRAASNLRSPDDGQVSSLGQTSTSPSAPNAGPLNAAPATQALGLGAGVVDNDLHPLDIVDISGPDGVTFKKLSDGSFLVSGQNPPGGTYQIDATTDVKGITGFRLEAIPDESLPAHGSGRAAQGGFMLSELQVFAAGGRKFTPQNQVRTHRRRRRSRAGRISGLRRHRWRPAYPLGGRLGRGPGALGCFRHGEIALAPGWPTPPRAALAPPVIDQQFGTSHTLGRFRVLAVTGPPLKKAVSTATASEIAKPFPPWNPRQCSPIGGSRGASRGNR